MADREKYLKRCPGFGIDKNGDPGIDMTARECRMCQEEDKDLWQACKAECEDGGTIVETEDTEKTEGDGEMAKKKTSKKKAVGKKGKAGKPKIKVTRTSIIADLIKKGGTVTMDEIVKTTEKAFPGTGATATTTNAYYLLNFAAQIGVVTKTGKGEYKVNG